VVRCVPHSSRSPGLGVYQAAHIRGLILKRALRALAGVSMVLAGVTTMSSGAWAASSSSTPSSSSAASSGSNTGNNVPGLLPIGTGPTGYYTYTLAAGQSVQGQIEVKNLDTQPETYPIYPVDATTSPVTGVSYGQDNTPPHGTAAWVHLSVQGSISLAAASSQVVNFTVTVPAGTGPGQWVAGISAQQPQAAYQPVPNANSSKGTQVGINVTTRAVVAIVVTVPGPQTYGIGLGQPQLITQNGQRQVLNLPIKSTGDMLMKPYLDDVITSCSNTSPILTLQRQLDTFVPRTSIQYPWYLQSPTHLQILPAGCYRVHEQMYQTEGGTQLANQTFTFNVTPTETKVNPTKGLPVKVVSHHSGLPAWVWIIIGVGVLLLLLAALLLWRMYRKMRELSAGRKPGATERRDNE
jgi:hypothetical protein